MEIEKIINSGKLNENHNKVSHIESQQQFPKT